MKILALGDFHGKFPVKLRKKIKKEEPDLIVSIGDYPSFSFKKIFFKHSWGRSKQVWEVIGKTKTKELVEKDWKNGENVLKALNKMPVPVFTIVGNYEGVINDTFDINKTYLKDV